VRRRLPLILLAVTLVHCDWTLLKNPPGPPAPPSPSPSAPPTPAPTQTPGCGSVTVCPGGTHCVEGAGCVPDPSPAPTPLPSTPPPIGADGNYPLPAPGVCPAHFVNSLAWVGITFTGRVDAGHGLTRYNFDATPHSQPPFCPHAPGNLKCEQLAACQDPAGPDFYMTLPGMFTNAVCDKFSNNPYKCHHVPERGQGGPTTVCAVPAGAPPDSRAGRCVTVNVQP
jgi:hypothetical protein